MVWWILATMSAFFVKGLCGFANTLVFTSILSFANENVNISPVDLLLGYPSNLILTWKERKSIKWSVCLPLTALVIAGCIPGALFLKNANTGIVKIIFGIVIVLIGLEMLLREYRAKVARKSGIKLVVIGVLSGLLCGLYGIGALLGAYISRVTDGSSAFKANICFVFLAENTFRVVLYAVWGILTFEVCKQAVLLLPLMLLGLGLGILSGKFLDEKIVKKLVIILLMVSGVMLILNSL